MNVAPLFLRKHFTLRVSCIFLRSTAAKFQFLWRESFSDQLFNVCFLSAPFTSTSGPPCHFPFLCLLMFIPVLPGLFHSASRQCYQLILKHTHLWQQQELTSCSTTRNRFLCSINFKREPEHRQFIEKFTFLIKWKVNEDNIRRKHSENKNQFTEFWLLLFMQSAPS